jgi:DNA-binding transcriptional MocR family regulator
MDELEDLLLRYRPKLIYTNPTFQNPTGVTLPVRTRREMIQLATRYRVPIVEDETYCELSLGSAQPPPSLYQLDEDGTVVIRVNSFSKVLAPGLRLGWVGAARPIIEQLALMKQQVDPGTQNLVQLVVSRLLENGMFDRHLLTLRGEHRRRRDVMAKALQRHTPTGALRFAMPEGGLFLWCRLGSAIAARDVQQRALADSVAVVTGQPFYTDGGGSRELRLCFSSRTPDVLVSAAKIVAESVVAAGRHADLAEPISRIV